MKASVENVDTQILRFADDMIARDATFLVNHSGGKDSQAMYGLIKDIVPSDKIEVIHATLDRLEWPGTIDHIKETIDHELHVVTHVTALLDYVRKRGKWFSPSQRYCTSMQKTCPIDKWTRGYAKATGNNLIVNCMGIRAEESSNRAKKDPIKKNSRLSKAGREVWDLLPIFHWSTSEVFSYIEDLGQSPHWAYKKGMSRLSCSICIMSNKQDLLTASELRPDLLREYTQLEREIGHTFIMPRKGEKSLFLDQYVSKLKTIGVRLERETV